MWRCSVERMHDDCGQPEGADELTGGSLEGNHQGRRRRRVLRSIDAVGVIGVSLLVLCSWLLPFVTRFDVVHNAISALALAQFGFLQTMSFVLGGIGTLFITLILRILVRTRTATVGTTLLTVAGLSLFAVAAFPTDVIGHPDEMFVKSGADLVHIVATLTGLTCGILGLFVFAAAFRRDLRWRSLVVWSVGLAACALGGLITRLLRIGDGLLERLIVTTIAAWLVTVGIAAWHIIGPFWPGSHRDRSGRDAG